MSKVKNVNDKRSLYKVDELIKQCDHVVSDDCRFQSAEGWMYLFLMNVPATSTEVVLRKMKHFT